MGYLGVEVVHGNLLGKFFNRLNLEKGPATAGPFCGAGDAMPGRVSGEIVV